MVQSVAEWFSEMLAGWVTLVWRRARLVVTLTILLTITLSYYTASTLTVNTDTSSMISADLPYRQQYTEYKRLFPQLADNIVIVIDSGIAELSEQTARDLAARMNADKERFEYVFAASSEQFFRRNGLLFLDLEALDDVVNRVADTEPLLARLSTDPSLRGLLEILSQAVNDIADTGPRPEGLGNALERIAAVIEAGNRGQPEYLSWQALMDSDKIDGSGDDPGNRRQFVIARPTMDFSTLQPARAALAAVHELANSLPEVVEDGVNVRITGPAAINTEELSSVSAGASLAGIISLILVTLVLGLGLRPARLVFATLFSLVVGLVWTAAFATFAIGYLNMISVAFAVLFIGLGVDFGIHFCLRFQEELDAGAPAGQAMGQTAKGVGVALALCAPTTALAFYSFIPTAYAGLAQLGLISGTGVLIALAVSLTVLPALLKLMPAKPRLRPVANRPGKAGRPWVERHAKPVLVVSALLGAAAIPLAAQIHFDFDPMRLRDPGTESIATANELFRDPDTSPYTIQILTPDDRRAKALVPALEALPSVKRVITLTSMVPADQQEKLDLVDQAALILGPLSSLPPPMAVPDMAARKNAVESFRQKITTLENTARAPAIAIAGRRLLAALDSFSGRVGADDGAWRQLETRLLRFLPDQVDRLMELTTADFITADTLPAKIRARYQGVDGTVRIELFPSGDLTSQRAQKIFVREVQKIAPAATGATVQIVESGKAVVSSMREAILWATILITALLLLVFRSLGDTVAVLGPLLLAAILTAAASTVLGLSFNFANVIVLPLLIGLGVDGGIHLVMRSREEAGEAAVMATSTPRAVLLSALTTVGSFGSLAVSSHRGTASMGELLTVAITITLFSTLVVLPALIAVMAKRSAAKPHRRG